MAMLPNSKSRTQAAYEDLDSHVSQIESEETIESEDYKNSVKALFDAKSFLDTI